MRASAIEYAQADHERRLSALCFRLEWPDHPVCDLRGCPAERKGYCLECHMEAYNAMLDARRWIVETLIGLGFAP